jgi:hypothetical protein
MRVSRVDFSGPYQGCMGMRTQGVRGGIWPVSCGFAAGFSVELLAHSAAQGMRTQCPDQRDPDGTGQRSVFGVLPWRPVGRYGRAFGAPAPLDRRAEATPEPSLWALPAESRIGLVPAQMAQSGVVRRAPARSALASGASLRSSCSRGVEPSGCDDPALPGEVERPDC